MPVGEGDMPQKIASFVSDQDLGSQSIHFARAIPATRICSGNSAESQTAVRMLTSLMLANAACGRPLDQMRQ